MSEKDNMELWNQVCTTNPADTKPFRGKGGFKGTAIAAQSQRKRATELWGSFGCKWGIRNEQFSIMKLSEDPHDTIMAYSAELFYPNGAFGIHSDIDLWIYVKTGKYWQKTTDIQKKVRTDAFTKGLSELGFNADVFLGLFDENKYVQSLKNAEPEPEPITDEQVKQIFELQDIKKITSDDFTARLNKKYKVDNIDRLDTNQGAELIRLLKAA